MRILITGGAGFIGSAVVRHCLRNTGHEVVNVDKLTYAANLENLDGFASCDRYRFERADICDAQAIGGIFAKYDPDAVLHLAAESHVDRSIDGPDDCIRTNIFGTYVLIEASRRHFSALPESRKARARFHHVSTDEVFGSLGETGAFTEETPYAPNSPYSSSKASSDMLVRAWNRTYGLPIVISNCSNNYGPFQFPEKLFPNVILSALAGRRIPVYGSGMNVRDWLHVDDHARALLAILERGRNGESYNVGGRGEMRNIDLVRLICRTLDQLKPESPHVPHERLIEHVTDRPGHDARYAINPSKIERELGWKREMNFETGVRHTVLWYLENEQWWKSIQKREPVGKRLGLGTQQGGMKPAHAPAGLR